MIGEITPLPPAWTWTTLESTVDILDGRREPINSTERTARIAGKSSDKLYPYYGATGQVGWIDGFLFDEEILLVGEDGAPFFDGGRSKAYIVRGKSWVNNHAHVLRALAGLTSNALLKHYLDIFDYRGSVTGTTRLKLPQGALRRIPLPLPPLPEQRAIVAKIEQVFSELEDGVANLKKAQEQLKTYRQAVLKWAFEGKLTEEWRKERASVATTPELRKVAKPSVGTYNCTSPQHHSPAHETAADLLARIRREREEHAKKTGKKLKPVKPLTDKELAELPTLPEGWAWVRVNEVGSVQLGRQRAPQHHKGPHMRPYLRVANVFEDLIDTSDVKEMNFDPDEYETFKLGYGDILLNEGQSPEFLGRPAMYRNEVPGACFQNTLIRFQSGKHVLPDYALIVFRGYMHTGRFRKTSQITTNIAHMSAGRFSEIEFPLPTLEEQAEIASEVSRRLSIVQNLEVNIEEALRKSEALRQSILKKAFEGKLLSAQELEETRRSPDWEPAEKLLERIRREREESGR